MLNILLFTDADVFAGTERHMLDLACGLREQGVQVRIACPQPGALAERAGEAGMEILPVAKGQLPDWRAVRTVACELRQGRADIIHAHNGRTALIASLAVRAAGRGRCIFTQHFLEPCHVRRRGLKAWASQRAHAWVNAGLHHVIAISEAVRENVLARGEAVAERVTTIPNGLQVAAVSEDEAGRVRAELNVAPDAPLIVCVARLEPEKDVKTLLAAMPAILKQHPGARLAVIGDGSQAEALRTQACTLGIDEAVRFTGFRHDARTFMAAGNIFVLPSLAEPFGLVLVEAMALGKPVVAANAGGPKEIVQESRTGCLVAPGQSEMLAAAIGSLLADPAAARTMGQQGRARYEVCYTAERMAQATVQVYQNVLHHKS